MTDIPKPATVEEVMAATGLGRMQVYRLTDEGRIPAQIIRGYDGQFRKFVMTRGQFEQLIRDGIAPPKPKPTDHPLAPSSFIRKVS